MGLLDEFEKKRQPTWWERFVEAPGRELTASAVNLPNRALDIVDFATRVSPMTVLQRHLVPGFEDQRQQEIKTLRGFLHPVEEFSQELRPEFEATTFTEKAGRTIAGAAPDLAATVLATIFGGPAGGYAVGAGMAGGASLKEAEARDVPQLEAEIKALVSAGVGGLLERFGAKPVAALLQRVPPALRNRVVRRTVDAMVREGGTEIAQEGLDTGLEALTGADVGSAGDVFERLALAGVAGGALAGGVGAARKAVDLLPSLDTTGGAKETLKRYGSTRAGLPEEFFQSREVQEQQHEANVFEAKDRSDRYRSARDQLAAGDAAALSDMIQRHNEWLEAPLEAKSEIFVEPEVASILQEMRAAADANTREILAHPGWTTDSQRVVLESNIGEYHYRSYDIHDDPAQRLAIVAPHLNSTLAEVASGDPRFQPSEEWVAAREWLRAQNSRARTDENLDAELRTLFDLDNDVIESHSMQAAMGGAIPGINRSPLYARKLDLHPELRALLGEQFDPAVRHMKTIQNVSRMVTTRQMYDSMITSGRALELFQDPKEIIDPTRFVSLQDRGGQGSTVAKEMLRSQPLETGAEQAILAGVPRGIPALEGKERWEIVNDIYADENLMSALDAATNQVSWRQLMRTGDLGIQAMAGFAMAAQMGKAGNTVFRVQTQSRNLLSNSLAVLANGDIIPGRWDLAQLGPEVPNPGAPFYEAAPIAAASAELPQLLGLRPSTRRVQQAAEKKRRGVAGGNVDVGDLDYFFSEFFPEVETSSKTMRALGFVPRLARRSYIIGDEVAKNAVDGREQRKMAWAFQEELESGRLTMDDVRAVAAETVKSNMQNYDRQPEVVQAIRKIPVIGPYVAFPAAMTINLKNIVANSAMVELGWREAKQGTPLYKAMIAAGPTADRRLKEVGLHRAGSTAVAMGAGSITAEAVRFLAVELFQGVAQAAGGEAGPELSDEDKADLVWSAPFYQQSSELIPFYRAPGKMYVLDFSQNDYFGGLKRVVLANLRAGDLDENAWTAPVRELIEPYFQMDVLTGAVGQVLFNKDLYGEKIYPETESPLPLAADFTWDAFAMSLEHVTLATMGQAKDVIKLHKAMKGEGHSGRTARDFDVATELGAWMGVRPTIIDFEKNLVNMIYSTASDLGDLTEKLNDVVRARGEIPLERQSLAFAAGEEAVLKRYQRLLKAKEIALRQGVSEDLVNVQIETHRLGKLEKAMLYGAVTPEEAAQIWSDKQRANSEKARGTKLALELARWELRQTSPPTPQERQEKEEELSRLYGPL